MTTVDPEVLAAAERDADAAAARSRAEVRTLHTHEELAEARDLWDAVWPSPTGTEVTNNHLRAIEHSGGYVGGAFDDGVMVGACLAFVGRTRSHDRALGWHTHLHSHMAAVLPQAADRGIGTAIKLHQRAWSLRHDIDRIVWTYDPLGAAQRAAQPGEARRDRGRVPRRLLRRDGRRRSTRASRATACCCSGTSPPRG